MTTKALIYLGMFAGSFVGGWVPTLVGQSPLGLWSIVGVVFGGFIGIWAGFKFGQMIEG